jgi:polar amino acid transport system substrate-binding protein
MWAQRPGVPIDPNNACRVKVAVQATTFQDTVEIPAKSDASVKAGKPPIDKVNFDRQDDATNALVLGEVDAMSADSPVIGYSIKQGGASSKRPVGLRLGAVRLARRQGLAAGPIAAAAVGAPDPYGPDQTILSNWGVESRAVAAPVINGAVS